jgi:hypothetical protein
VPRSGDGVDAAKVHSVVAPAQLERARDAQLAGQPDR